MWVHTVVMCFNLAHCVQCQMLATCLYSLGILICPICLLGYTLNLDSVGYYRVKYFSEIQSAIGTRFYWPDSNSRL